MNLFSRFVLDEDGQGMVEYALIIGIMSIVAVFLLMFVGKKVASTFNHLNTEIDKTGATS